MERTSKITILKPVILSLVFMLLLLGCQEEFIDIREPDKRITIIADDAIADLILKVVRKDGSADNFIDECSEISILFPYNIMIDEQQFTITSQEDIDAIMLDYFFEHGDIEIVFPVTVSLSDYTELTLTDPDELEDLQELFNEELLDDDIECIDLEYPIEAATYNTLQQITDVASIGSDMEMFEIFSSIGDLVVEISFPIEVSISDGQVLSIADNFELEEMIGQFKDMCDEEDEVEFSDEDYPLLDLLADGDWTVTWYSDTTDETSSFDGYLFSFRSDLEMRVNTGTAIIEGAWEPDVHSNDIFLDMDFETDEAPLEWLKGEWSIVSVNSSRIELETESDVDGYIKTLHLVRSDSENGQ